MKVLIATDKPFAQVAIDGILKVVSEEGFELKFCEKYGSDIDRLKRTAADVEAEYMQKLAWLKNDKESVYD